MKISDEKESGRVKECEVTLKIKLKFVVFLLLVDKSKSEECKVNQWLIRLLSRSSDKL